MMPLVSNFEDLMFQNIIDVSPAHIFWKNKDGVYLGSNQANLKYLGFKSLEELLGKNDFEIIDSISAKQVREIDLEVMKNAKLFILKEKDFKNEHVFLSYKAPLLNHNNEVVGIIGHSITITNQEMEKRNLLEQNYSFLNRPHNKR